MELGKILEQSARFSQSILWDYNRRYYEGTGTTAWHSGQVPSNATCNPYIAQCYAHVILAWMRDGIRAGLIDPAEPVHVVELAAGLGRFAFQLVTILKELVERSSIRGARVKYVMTDLARSNVQAWTKHPRLAPLVAEGWLDFGTFDAGRDTDVTFARGGTLGRVTNPMVVIGNYAFDSFPHDLVSVERGALYDRRVTVRMPPAEQASHPTNPPPSELRLGYDLRPVEAGHFADPIVARIAEGYRARMGDVTIALPTGGMAALRNLGALCGNRMLVLASDKGYTREDELYTARPDELQFHAGCFSLMVNFHALGQWFLEQGGHYAATSRCHLRLKSAAYILGGTAEQLADTLATIRDKLEQFGPGECFEHLELERQTGGAAELDHILGLLRLGNFDPGLVWQFARRLRILAPDADPDELAELRASLDRCWRFYFPGPQNLPFEIARIFTAMRRPLEAIRYFEMSLGMFGDQAATHLELGIAQYEAERPEQALASFAKATELDPTLSAARQWTARLIGEQKPR